MRHFLVAYRSVIENCATVEMASPATLEKPVPITTTQSCDRLLLMPKARTHRNA